MRIALSLRPGLSMALQRRGGAPGGGRGHASRSIPSIRRKGRPSQVLLSDRPDPRPARPHGGSEASRMAGRCNYNKRHGYDRKRPIHLGHLVAHRCHHSPDQPEQRQPEPEDDHHPVTLSQPDQAQCDKEKHVEDREPASDRGNGAPRRAAVAPPRSEHRRGTEGGEAHPRHRNRLTRAAAASHHNVPFSVVPSGAGGPTPSAPMVRARRGRVKGAAPGGRGKETAPGGPGRGSDADAVKGAGTCAIGS